MVGTITAITQLAASTLGIIDKFVPDKDLAAKLANRALELQYDLLGKLINTTTVPWVDALVKLMAASVALARPIGSFALTCAGIYMHVKGTQMDPTVHYALDSAFPAWGAAREVHKKREENTKQKALELGIPPWE